MSDEAILSGHGGVGTVLSSGEAYLLVHRRRVGSVLVPHWS